MERSLELIRSYRGKSLPLYVVGSLTTLVLALVNIFGVKGLMSLNMAKSIYFGEDTTFNLAIIKRISEGWIYNNTRMGYPFGSSLYDYPIPDFASLIYFKFLSYFGFDPIVILNTYFFVSFPITFIITIAVLRRLNFSIFISGLISFLFTLLPFHFERFSIGHLFYTWYFVVPLYALIALDAADLTSHKIYDTNSRRGIYKLILTSAFLACFGVYYALFGMILLITTGFFIGKRHELNKLKPILISMATTFVTLFLILLPNIIFRIINGSNSLVAARSPVESEVYGLKFVQFIMPNYEHRIENLRRIANSYASSFPLINENMMSSLGVLGSIGLLFLLIKTAQLFAGHSQTSKSVRFYVFNFWVLFMFATVGGFGTVFALAISPQIRGWNRIGIFISFIALLGLATLLRDLHLRVALPKVAASIFATVMLIGGVADAMPRTCESCIKENAKYSKIQSRFVNQIESSLPKGAAVFQYPYAQFPEVPKTNSMDSYSQLEGFIFSEHLLWSSGGIKGGGGDNYLSSLATQSTEFQYQALMKLGFNAVYIDGRGFEDGGSDALRNWKTILKKEPDLVREDGIVSVFILPQQKSPPKKPIRVQYAKELTSFGPNGFTYPTELESELIFSRPGIPSYLQSFSGLSNPETWGRWSDARLSRNVEFVYANPLPNEFELVVNVFGYEANVGKTLQIVSGRISHEIELPRSATIFRFEFDFNDSPNNRITFKIPTPTSPSNYEGSGDNRLLGVGFISMQVIPRD